ncbi:MAG: hypothetical protein IPH33_17280 [Bacteroidetes bacterium]|nr:hypothetical protein [Bacteroidota bacterium]
MTLYIQSPIQIPTSVLDSLNTTGSFDKTFADFKNISVGEVGDNFQSVHGLIELQWRQILLLGYIQIKNERQIAFSFPLSDSASSSANRNQKN